MDVLEVRVGGILTPRSTFHSLSGEGSVGSYQRNRCKRRLKEAGAAFKDEFINEIRGESADSEGRVTRSSIHRARNGGFAQKGAGLVLNSNINS